MRDGENITGHKPSVDVLFSSVAKVVGNKATGVILTGIGKDGGTDMLAMKHSRAFTIGQDDESCIVYGMPKAAFLAGAVDKQYLWMIFPLN